jgi:hypothetical protein
MIPCLPCIVDRVLVNFEECARSNATLSNRSLEETATLWRQIVKENAHGTSTFAKNCHLLKKSIVNFTDILRSAFLPIFFYQKIQTQTVSIEKLCKTLSYKKAAHKMVVKLTHNSIKDDRDYVQSVSWI